MKRILGIMLAAVAVPAIASAQSADPNYDPNAAPSQQPQPAPQQPAPVTSTTTTTTPPPVVVVNPNTPPPAEGPTYVEPEGNEVYDDWNAPVFATGAVVLRRVLCRRRDRGQQERPQRRRSPVGAGRRPVARAQRLGQLPHRGAALRQQHDRQGPAHRRRRVPGGRPGRDGRRRAVADPPPRRARAPWTRRSTCHRPTTGSRSSATSRRSDRTISRIAVDRSA